MENLKLNLKKLLWTQRWVKRHGGMRVLCCPDEIYEVSYSSLHKRGEKIPSLLHLFIGYIGSFSSHEGGEFRT